MNHFKGCAKCFETVRTAVTRTRTAKAIQSTDWINDESDGVMK